MRQRSQHPAAHEWLAPFVLAAVVVAVIGFASGVVESVVWIVGNGLCAVAMVFATRRRQPFRPLLWQVVAGAIACFVPYGICVRGSRQGWLDPTWADPVSAVALAIGAVLAIVAGVLLLPRGRAAPASVGESWLASPAR